LNADWNQDLLWADITKVCFKDESISESDVILLQLREPKKWAAVLTEAQGGPEFIAQLVARELFPMHMLKKAVASSTGRTYCCLPARANAFQSNRQRGARV
jgi:hypothetical protein